jgi:hypothetical protein
MSAPWVQCTSVSNECLGGCRSMREHDAYRRQQADCGHAGDVGRACGRCTECVKHELAKVRAELKKAQRAALVGQFAAADALAQAAADRLSRGLERVQLVVPRPCTGARRMRVLGGTDGRKALMGEVCGENADGHTVVWVDAVDLLAWLAAYEGVRVETSRAP